MPYSRRRQEAAARVPHVETLADHRRLPGAPRLRRRDGAPTRTCSAQFRDTLAAGKDLYAEKTMTWSIAEADSAWPPRTFRPRGATVACSTETRAPSPTAQG